MSSYLTITFQTLTKDNFGNRVVSASNEVAGCIFAPAASSENLEFEDQTKIAATLYCPYGTDPTPYEQAVTPDGTIWEVNGDPNDWQNPFTDRKAGTVITLSRVVS